MQKACWNAFCIAGRCNGVDHVDATGDTWSQRKGFEYNPESGEYDLPDPIRGEPAARAFTVEIQAAGPPGDWQAVMPAETVRTDSPDNTVYDTDGGAAELARDVYNNQDVAAGTVRVCVWDGADADTSSAPTAVFEYDKMGPQPVLTELTVWVPPAGGWEWVVRWDDGRTSRYRTDVNYEGLWLWTVDGPSAWWRQLKGHMQATHPSVREDMLACLAREYGYEVSIV